MPETRIRRRGSSPMIFSTVSSSPGIPKTSSNSCARLYDAGAHRVELGTPHGLSEAGTGIRLIGEQVIPALKPYLAPT